MNLVAVESRWIGVCRTSDILPDTGACVLVGAEQVAIIHYGATGEFFALSNFDPFSKAFVISRGIVGDRNGKPKIASPMYKQNFDLTSGSCLDDSSVCLRTYGLRVVGDLIEIETLES